MLNPLVRNPSKGRVLVYHEMTPSSFAAQIRDVSALLNFVDIDTAARLLRGEPSLNRSPFALLTFDDGYRAFLGVMDELLHLAVPACLYITRDYLGRPGYLQEADVRTISESFAIGSHTISHPRLLELDDAHLARELVDSKSYLEDLTGKPVVHFASPFGGPNAFGGSAIRMAAEAGYTTFRTTFRGWNGPRTGIGDEVRLLRADIVEDWYPAWRLKLTLAGALDWRASYRLRRALAA